MEAGARTDHDGLYHRLFSDPRVVAQLLRGFVAGPWLADLDLDAMERLKPNSMPIPGSGARAT